MKCQRISLSIALAIVSSLSGVAFTQNASQTQNSSPVAFVYVTNSPQNNSYFQINGFSADVTGRLTPIVGSPFAGNIRAMAVNGKYLFGTDQSLATGAVNIDTFAIASDGSLRQITSTSAGESGDGFGTLVLDHTGSSLYGSLYESQFGSDLYETFSVDSSTGALAYRNETAASPQFGWRLAFIANNLYAYGANCNGSQSLTPDIFGFKRNADQTLTQLNIQPKTPQAPNKGEFYCPFQTAADTSNHVAIPMVLIGKSAVPVQIATYTTDNHGNLTTRSTAANMPKTAFTWVNAVRMSPSGKLLAVAGMTGLQVFHFNGSGPVTHYTGVLTTDEIDQVLWDNDNHLYALNSGGNNPGKLYVFTVTPTSYKQAPGSPYVISHPFWPDGMIVQPLH